MGDIKSYQFSEGFKITDEMKQSYAEDGYVLVRGLFPQKEVTHIEQALQTGPFAEHTFGLPDDSGKEAHMILWNHPGVDVTGMVARCEKIVSSCESFLDGEVYHYHTKLMKKPAKIGGKHIWHQDYGYWYGNGCLFPNMMTVFISIDRCAKTNGCLQVLKGSHKCGRIEHKTVAGQTGADMDRVNEILKICPLEYVEMEPGDALFFDCNLLHCSSSNTSLDRRWAFLCAYNRVDNNPTFEHHHPRYTKLEKVPDSAILDCKEFANMDGKWFLDIDNINVQVPDSAILDCKEFTNMDGKWFLDFDKMKVQVHGRKVPLSEQ